jgi:hypothetical protein
LKRWSGQVANPRNNDSATVELPRSTTMFIAASASMWRSRAAAALRHPQHVTDFVTRAR